VANQEQWHHAHGVVKALREEIPKRPGFPCVILLCGNKEKESTEILKEGTKDLPGRIESMEAIRFMRPSFWQNG
jgi:succinyl-CoA synthetase beta subunit